MLDCGFGRFGFGGLVKHMLVFVLLVRQMAIASLFGHWSGFYDALTDVLIAVEIDLNKVEVFIAVVAFE